MRKNQTFSKTIIKKKSIYKREFFSPEMLRYLNRIWIMIQVAFFY